MTTLKKGQSVDFRNSGVPVYIPETRQLAYNLASEIAATYAVNNLQPRKKKSFVAKLKDTI